MAFRFSSVSMASLVITRKAYGDRSPADYPNLASKAK
jgi:hypothetical protein